MDILLKVLLVIFSIGLIAVVLLQKGKSAGLAGAISGELNIFSEKRKRAAWSSFSNESRSDWQRVSSSCRSSLPSCWINLIILAE